MKSRGTYLITAARVHSFEGGGGYSPAKTFYADLLGTDRHRFELVVSRERWPEFFEVAVKNFTIGKNIDCDFLYYPNGSNALEIRLAAWYEVIATSLILHQQQLQCRVRHVVSPEPIPLDGEVAIWYFDETGEYNFPLKKRGDRLLGRFLWVPFPKEPETSKQQVIPPAKEHLFTRFFRWLASP